MSSFSDDWGLVTRCGWLFRTQRLAQYGLNGSQNTYIINICENPGISQEQLSKLIYINKSNVARQLALLEQNGFVDRARSASDKRAMEIYPTEKCKAVYAEVAQITDDWVSLLLSTLTEGENEQIYNILTKLKQQATSYIDKTHDAENL